jgi:HEAT repeat protein
MDEKSMLAAYAATYGDEHDRLLLADYFEERNDPRGVWLRDPELARWMGPEAANPFVKLVATLPDDEARQLLVRLGGQSVPALLADWPGGVETFYEEDRRHLLSEILNEIRAQTPDLAELVERLRSADPREQREALEALGERGESAGAAIPAILRLLHEDRGSIRASALATLERMGALTESALYAAWGETGWHFDDDEFNNYRLPIPLIDACERFGPRSRLVGSIVRAMNTANWDIPERARDVLCRFGVESFEVVLEEGSRLRRGAGYVREILRSYPGACERLLAVAKDARRPENQRCCAIASLVPALYAHKECGPELDWLLPHLTELLDDTNPTIQREAVLALRWFGERSSVANPALLRLLGQEDEWFPYSVLTTLQSQGSDTVRALLPFVRPLVQHSSPMVQGAAKRIVKRFTAADEQIREVREALYSEDAQRRRQAIPRLLDLSTHFPDLFDLLSRALADKDEAVRLDAASEVVRRKWPEDSDLQPLLRKALTELLEQLQSGSPETRVRIVNLLAQPSVRGPEARAATCAALKDEEPVRQAALWVLQDSWQPLPDEAVPGLIHLVRTDPSYQGSQAASLLLNVFPPPDDFLPALRERLRLGEAIRSALDPLERLNYVPTEEELPLLVTVLDDDLPRGDIGSAARLLARMGPTALPHLISHLTPDNVGWLSRALATMGPAAREALPALGALVDHDWGFVRSSIVEAIAAIGTPEDILSLLRPAFRDRDNGVRGKVLEVCSQLGANARPWLPELMHLVRTEDSPGELRPVQLAPVLAGLATHIPEMVALLQQALNEPGTARANAVSALGALGAGAAEAVPDLEALLVSASQAERLALEEALARIRGLVQPPG